MAGAAGLCRGRPLTGAIGAAAPRYPSRGLPVDVEPLDRVDCSALRWLRSEAHPAAFDLLAGNHAVAAMRWHRPSGSLAEAETAEGRWTLKRTGFLHGRVTLRAAGADTDAAQISIHWRRSTLELAGGGRYPFERAGLAVPAWQFLGPGGDRWIHIEPVREKGRLVGGLVTVEPAAQKLPELAKLLVTGWYYVAQEWFEDEAAALTAAVAATIG